MSHAESLGVALRQIIDVFSRIALFFGMARIAFFYGTTSGSSSGGAAAHRLRPLSLARFLHIVAHCLMAGTVEQNSAHYLYCSSSRRPSPAPPVYSCNM
jgi:hypothetical protein